MAEDTMMEKLGIFQDISSISRFIMLIISWWDKWSSECLFLGDWNILLSLMTHSFWYLMRRVVHSSKYSSASVPIKYFNYLITELEVLSTDFYCVSPTETLYLSEFFFLCVYTQCSFSIPIFIGFMIFLIINFIDTQFMTLNTQICLYNFYSIWWIGDDRFNKLSKHQELNGNELTFAKRVFGRKKKHTEFWLILN